MQSSLTDLNLFKFIENLVFTSWNVHKNNHKTKSKQIKVPKQTKMKPLKKTTTTNLNSAQGM